MAVVRRSGGNVRGGAVEADQLAVGPLAHVGAAPDLGAALGDVTSGSCPERAGEAAGLQGGRGQGGVRRGDAGAERGAGADGTDDSC